MATLKEKRAEVLKKLRPYQKKLTEDGLTLTPEETQTVKDLLKQVNALDEQYAKAKEDAELMRYFDLPAGATTPTSDDGDSYTGNPGKKGRADIRSLVKSIPGAARKYSSALTTKGLAPTGAALVSIPIVNSQPIAGDIDAEIPPRLVDYLPTVQRRTTDAAGASTTAASYDILVETSGQDSGKATVVAPGTEKPVKKLQLERRTQSLKVMAVLSEPIDRYVLEDARNIESWMGGRLTQEILDALDTEILEGDGTGVHFTGLAHATGTQAQAFDANILDTVAAGANKLEAHGIGVQLIALSPTDWLKVQTFKDAAGRYYLGNVIDPMARKLYGHQVVSVPGLQAGTGWVIGTDTLSLSTDGQIKVEWDRSRGFTRNEIQARVEGRFNLDILKPHGLVKLNLTAPSGK